MLKWQAHTHQDLQTRAVDRQLDERSICDLMQKIKREKCPNCNLHTTAVESVFM